MKKSKNIILIAILSVIMFMSVGYSKFATQLSINGNAEIVGEWNVKITNVEAKDVSEGCDSGQPQYTDTTVAFDAKLNKPGDSVSYEITIENAGTIDAVLDSAVFSRTANSPAIGYIISNPADVLDAGQVTSITITAVYYDTVTELPEIKNEGITGTIDYVQK